jgi:hypothetical protein
MDHVAKAFEDFGYGVSRKMIENEIWPRFRSVAHLWGAVVYCRSAAFPCRQDELERFLHIAEFMRSDGEAWRPKQSGRTLLTPGKTWRLPDDIRLEKPF